MSERLHNGRKSYTHTVVRITHSMNDLDDRANKTDFAPTKIIGIENGMNVKTQGDRLLACLHWGSKGTGPTAPAGESLERVQEWWVHS